MSMDYILSLPDDCLSAILSKTSPRDVCRSSAISTRFRAIIGCDSVWERFLPADYRPIIARSASPLPFDALKQLFFLLADSYIILDGRSLSFALDKGTGKKCYMLGARELAISWGDTGRHWRWFSMSHSRFPKVAHLIDVCWLEIRGKLDTSLLSPNTTYAAYFVYRLTPRCCGFESAPIKASVSLTGGGREQQLEREMSVVCLQPGEAMDVAGNVRIPRRRSKKWMEVELGEFHNDGDGGGEVEMVVMEVEMGTLKIGLIVEGMELRPKE